MQKFISSLIPHLSGKKLMYTGDVSDLNKTIDAREAADYYYANEGNFIKKSFQFHILGEILNKEINVLSDEYLNTHEVTNAQKECNDMVKVYSKGGIISDEFYQLLSSVFARMEVVNTDEGFYAFRLLNKDEKSVINTTTVNIDESSFEVNFDKPYPELTEDEFRYSNVMLVIKEVSRGFHSFRTHNIIQTEGKKKVLTSFKIAQDLTVYFSKDGTSIEHVDAVETAYDLKKIESVWSVCKDGKFVAKTDEFQYIVHDKETNVMKIYGAYTHILRKVLGFIPQTWQLKYLMNEHRLNTVAGTRRGGKTILSSYRVLRRMYCNPSSKKHVLRQVKATYMAPTVDKFKTVLDYIETSTERIKVLKTLRINNNTNRLSLVDESLSHNGSPIRTVIATTDFVSGQGFEPARGNGSDDFTIDESGYISEDVYLTILPIIENENSDFMAISTIDWETPKHWFYELLISYEQGGDIEGYAQRVTIDDIDEHIISTTSRDRIKKALKKNLGRYYAELYATFPSIGSVFNTSNFYIVPTHRQNNLYAKEVIIGYDPAKRSDYGGLITAIVYSDGSCILEEELRLHGDYNTDQKPVIKALKERYKGMGVPVSLIMDCTAVGEVVAEMFGNIVDFKVWYTSSTNSGSFTVDKYGVWHISKRQLVHLFQILVDTKNIQAYTSLVNLISEVKNFKMFHTSSGGIKYEADTGHDDLVNAAMLIGFYIGHFNGQLYKIGYDNSTNSNEGLSVDNLYKAFSRPLAKSNNSNSLYKF